MTYTWRFRVLRKYQILGKVHVQAAPYQPLCGRENARCCTWAHSIPQGGELCKRCESLAKKGGGQ